MKAGSTFISGMLGVLVGAALVGGIVWAWDDDGGNAPASGGQPTTGQPADTARDDAPATTEDGGFAQLYERVRPSVVRITTGNAFDDPFSDRAEGLGSGVIIDGEGHIITNYHVVAGFDEVTVTFADGTVAGAEVVGRDPGNDIAVVQVDDVDATLLAVATLGDSGAVEVGEVVAAVGNPFGLDGTFTTGVISGLNRTLPSSANGRPIRGLLQTDTAVNPGNSGGALFNLAGEVIGINTAIENPSGGGFAGVAYAVPIDTPKRFMTELVAGDTVEHARLGISGRTLSADEAGSLGLDAGVAVLAVEQGSAADEAGLRSSNGGAGDVIVAIDGQEVRTFEDIADYIDGKSIGDEVTLTVRRGDDQVELTARLKSWDSSA
jgi:S1-C subfamily serine protease